MAEQPLVFSLPAQGSLSKKLIGTGDEVVIVWLEYELQRFTGDPTLFSHAPPNDPNNVKKLKSDIKLIGLTTPSPTSISFLDAKTARFQWSGPRGTVLGKDFPVQLERSLARISRLKERKPHLAIMIETQAVLHPDPVPVWPWPGSAATSTVLSHPQLSSAANSSTDHSPLTSQASAPVSHPSLASTPSFSLVASSCDSSSRSPPCFASFQDVMAGANLSFHGSPWGSGYPGSLSYTPTPPILPQLGLICYPPGNRPSAKRKADPSSESSPSAELTPHAAKKLRLETSLPTTPSFDSVDTDNEDGEYTVATSGIGTSQPSPFSDVQMDGPSTSEQSVRISDILNNLTSSNILRLASLMESVEAECPTSAVTAPLTNWEREKEAFTLVNALAISLTNAIYAFTPPSDMDTPFISNDHLQVELAHHKPRLERAKHDLRMMKQSHDRVIEHLGVDDEIYDKAMEEAKKADIAGCHKSRGSGSRKVSSAKNSMDADDFIPL